MRTKKFFEEYAQARDCLRELRKKVPEEVHVQTIDSFLGNLRNARRNLRVVCGNLFCYVPQGVRECWGDVVDEIVYWKKRPYKLIKNLRK